IVMFQTGNIKGLTLSRLETFCEIAAAGGISKAARNDSNRQSQFSRQLKELEQFFGTELLKRGGALTDAGKHLLGCSGPLLNTLKQVAADIAMKVPTVAFGAGESVNNWWLIPRLERLSARVGEVQWTVCNLSTNSIISGLLDSKLDLGIVRKDACCAGLKFERLFVMRFFLCVPEPLLKRKWVPAAVLAGNGKLAVELRAVMAKLRPNFHARLECDSAVQ